MTVKDNNTTSLLLSTAYFPPVEYMALLLKHHSALIEIKETYYKQTWRNRCTIMTANGILNLTVPVVKPNGNRSTTSEIKVFNKEKWFLMHSRAIQSAYRASPFYLYYWDQLEDIFSPDYQNLTSLNSEILNRLIKIIGIKAETTYTSNFIKAGSSQNDYRTKLSPKKDTLCDNFPKYIQVFSDRYGFIENLSILDVIFNLGPDSINYLKQVGNKLP